MEKEETSWKQLFTKLGFVWTILPYTGYISTWERLMSSLWKDTHLFWEDKFVQMVKLAKSTVGDGDKIMQDMPGYITESYELYKTIGLHYCSLYNTYSWEECMATQKILYKSSDYSYPFIENLYFSLDDDFEPLCLKDFCHFFSKFTWSGVNYLSISEQGAESNIEFRLVLKLFMEVHKHRLLTDTCLLVKNLDLIGFVISGAQL